MPDFVSLNKFKISLTRFQLSITCLYCIMNWCSLVTARRLVTTLYVIYRIDVTVGQHTMHASLVNRTNSLFEKQPCHYKIIMCFPLPTDTKASEGLFCTLTAECMVNENVVKEPGYQPVRCRKKSLLAITYKRLKKCSGRSDEGDPAVCFTCSLQSTC